MPTTEELQTQIDSLTAEIQTLQTIYSLLQTTLKYTPIVYIQVSPTTEQISSGTEYTLEYKFTDIPDDGLLFFVPYFSNKSPSEGGTTTLVMRVPSYNSTTGSYVYAENTYTILVEDTDGTRRAAETGDIVAFRMCIFRFQKNSKNIILVNSPLYNSAAYNSITATDALFLNVPKVKNEDSTIPYTIATNADIDSLKLRVSALEDKFSYGTVEADEALADKPVGSIYLKLTEE